MKTLIKVFFNEVRERVATLLHRPRLLSVFMCVMIFGISSMYAAPDPFTEVTGTLLDYKDPIQKLIYSIAAIIALVGGFNIYNKMQNGDQDVKKTIMMTIGGCIALVALSSALPAFFV